MTARILYFLIFILITCTEGISQTKPRVNDPCPDFRLSYVTHYPKHSVSLNDFRGKWLFLDFWFSGCSSCINSFQKISSFQKKYNGQAQFLLVGYNSKKTEKNIEEMFEKLRIKQKLTIATAFDSVIHHTWGIQSMPHIVIVDPNGIVKFITDGSDLSEEKIQKIISKDSVVLSEKDKMYPDFKTDLTAYDGSIYPLDKLLNNSLITKWHGEKFYLEYSLDEYLTRSNEEKKKGFQVAQVNLEMLYTTAYIGIVALKFWGNPLYGKVYPFPDLKIRDSSLFRPVYDKNSIGVYNYKLQIPVWRVNKANIMMYMQQDLERAFGYNAFVEEREMPVWKLIATPEARVALKTKGGSPYYDAWDGKSIAAGFKVINIPMKDYLMYVCYYLNEKEKHPFIDATDIMGNIDLTIDADMTDIHDVQKELRKKGLDLILGTQKMKVLVIKDP